MENRIAIVAAKRTAHGAFGGVFANTPAPTLAGHAIYGAYADMDIDTELIDALQVGCVLTAGMRQAPARQVLFAAGLPETISATTVNKVCGSGMQTIVHGLGAIMSGAAKCVIAAGMENMSMAPYLAPSARFGSRYGHRQLLDHLFYDGLENAYESNALMGYFADQCAKEYAFTRKALDDFSIQSTERAQTAIANGYFEAEIVAVETSSGVVITQDEPPSKIDPTRIPKLRPVFSRGGVTTAGNASSIADGASAIILMPEGLAKKKDYEVLAYISGVASHGGSPELFPTAPIGAIRKVLKQVGWKASDVDLFEINEAFAVVTLATIQEFKLSPKQVNVHGGAIALGHPLGASGTRIVTTLVHALQQQREDHGVAAICIGGGEALALAVTRK